MSWRAVVGCALLCAMLCAPAFAQSVQTITLPTATLAQGVTADETITIDDATGSSTFSFVVGYDPMTITLNSVAATAFTVDCSVGMTGAVGSATITVTCPSPRSGGGNLATVSVTGMAVGISVLSNGTCNIDAATCTLVPGQITVFVPTSTPTTTPTDTATAGPSQTPTDTPVGPTATPTAIAATECCQCPGFCANGVSCPPGCTIFQNGQCTQLPGGGSCAPIPPSATPTRTATPIFTCASSNDCPLGSACVPLTTPTAAATPTRTP